MTWQDYRGAIHVHSIHSDGSGSIEEILDAARGAGLDFLILTDHSSMAHREAGWEGRHEGVLLIIGGEASPWEEPHAVILGLHDVHHLNQMTASRYLAATKAEGGHSFIAHPRGKTLAGMSLLPWTDWDNPDFTGIEIWSYMHDWIEDFTWAKLPWFYLNPAKRITGPHPDVLRAWDRVAARRPCPGIAGTDAHAKPMFAGCFKVFPYEMLFHTTLTHVLAERFTGEDAADVRRVIDALACGRSYMAYHVAADPQGFRFVARTSVGETQMGETVALGEKPVLDVALPAPADIRLIAGGREVRRVQGDRLTFEADEGGPYRVEVRREGRPWVFSNHIRVTTCEYSGCGEYLRDSE